MLEELSVVDTLELGTELSVVELCGEDTLSLLISTTMTVLSPPATVELSEMSEVLLQPVRLAHTIKIDSTAAKNLDFLFIITYSFFNCYADRPQ